MKKATKNKPNTGKSDAKVHWLGGHYVTPSCGAWAFCKGERTDDDYIPQREINCGDCLVNLHKKKNRKHLMKYIKR